MEDQKTIYEITIVRTRIEETIKDKEWIVGGTERPSGNGEYGYTPQTIETRDVEREIYRQTVEDLDLGKVIKAINFSD